MRLEKIIIGGEAKKPLHYVDGVQAVKGLGLEGERALSSYPHDSIFSRTCYGSIGSFQLFGIVHLFK